MTTPITQEQIDREAARIFREMFRPAGQAEDRTPASDEALASYRQILAMAPTIYRREPSHN